MCSQYVLEGFNTRRPRCKSRIRSGVTFWPDIKQPMALACLSAILAPVKTIIDYVSFSRCKYMVPATCNRRPSFFVSAKWPNGSTDPNCGPSDSPIFLFPNFFNILQLFSLAATSLRITISYLPVYWSQGYDTCTKDGNKYLSFAYNIIC